MMAAAIDSMRKGIGHPLITVLENITYTLNYLVYTFTSAIVLPHPKLQGDYCVLGMGNTG